MQWNSTPRARPRRPPLRPSPATSTSPRPQRPGAVADDRRPRRFAPGAHTNWHSHAVGQTLHVTEGVGLVGTRDGSVLRLRAGDTVVCPPGEEHWHGAAADTFLSHLAMLESLHGREEPTTWLEPVPDEDHQKADGR